MKYLTGLALLLCCSLAVAQEKSAGRFSGYMFGDYYYNVARDGSFAALSNSASGSAAPGSTAMQAFQMRRVYFTYDNDISEQFTSRFRLEVDQGTDVLTSGKIGVFVKDAYLRWKNIFSGSDLIFGIQPPPTYDVSEAAWGYRSLEKTIMDVRGIYSSRDVGLSLKGKLVESGTVNYWVMIGKNSGNAPAASKYNRYSAHIQIKPVANLQATVYADYKDAADVADPSKPGSFVNHTTFTSALFVGYGEQGKYNIGLEGFMTSTPNDYAKSGALTTRGVRGISLFGSVNVSSDLVLVGRFDNYNPNTDNDAKDPTKVAASVVAGSLARNYIIAGLDWKVIKNVSIIPNILYETYEAATGGTKPDASLTARITFYYIFL